MMFSFNAKESTSMKEDLKCGKKYSVTSEGIKNQVLGSNSEALKESYFN